MLIDARWWTTFCSTWVAVLIQISAAAQSKTKTGWKRADSPLARESLSGRVHQSSSMAIINENQSLLVVSSIGAADGHVCIETAKAHLVCEVLCVLIACIQPIYICVNVYDCS